MATRQDSGASAAARWVVGITDYLQPPAEIERQAFPEAEFRFLEDPGAGAAQRAAWREVDALLVWHWRVDAATAALLDRCRIVVRYGVGYDRIDRAALARRGIPLCNTPDYGTEEVADSACALILALQRKIVGYDRACRFYGSGWQEHLLTPTPRTSGQTLGLVGVGRIGTAVINRLRPFGYRILGYDPYLPAGHEKAVGYTRVPTLRDLLGEADVVSLHCPLTPETRGMIDAEAFGQMRPGAVLVNTARGEILDGLGGLEEALRSGRLAAAGLDVLPEEPPEAHPLLEAWRQDAPWLRGRLLITPHSAWHSEQAWREMRRKAAETVRLYLACGRLRNHIPPEAF